LNMRTVQRADGFDCVSIFTSDDASAPVIRKLKQAGVKYIAVRATGFDNVDIKEAENCGITVANVPKYSPFAVAEHATALILALERNIVIADEQVHNFNFLIDDLVGSDIHGKTVGIIGTGRIGSAMCHIMDGFGCKVLAYDLQKDQSLERIAKYVSLDELCEKADIISLHIPLNQNTRHLINKSLISRMKDNVMIINTARGAIVNTDDIIAGLRNGKIGYYGADVYESEKGIFFNDLSHSGLNDDKLKELMAMKNVLITPHQGFATMQAITNIAFTTFMNVRCWSRGISSPYELTNCYNEQRMTSSSQ